MIKSSPYSVSACERIVEEASRLLDSLQDYQQMSRAHNPYGDGRVGILGCIGAR